MKHLFLKGDSGVGKTTLLHEILKEYHGSIGGFMSRRLLDEKGDTAGFSLVEIKTGDIGDAVGSYDPDTPNLFMNRTGEGWKRYLQVFEGVGIKLLEGVEGKSLGYLDEIGGMEMKSEGFMNALYQVLAGDVCCIGVIKSEKNLKGMSAKFSMEGQRALDRDHLEETVIHEYGGQVLVYTRERHEEIADQIRHFLNGVKVPGSIN